MNQNRDWTTLYKTGAIAALLAGLVFRRNIGAEVSLFAGEETAVTSIQDWYALLQSRPLVGLSYLALFDVVNYALVGLMFLALGAALWQSYKSLVAIATASGLVGITLVFAANVAFPMLALSQQYAQAASEAERASLVSAGQAVMVFHNLPATYPGTGVTMSLLLIAVAGLLFSIVMRRQHFGPVTASMGIVASTFDLVYCLTFAFAPFLKAYLLAAGGLFWMLWHLMVARRLWQLSKEIK